MNTDKVNNKKFSKRITVVAIIIAAMVVLFAFPQYHIKVIF